MKPLLPLATVAISATMLIFTGCASNLSYQEAMNKNRRSLESMERLEDAEFLVEARSFNLLEKKVNELASQKGYSAELVQYAKAELEEQENLESELNKVSRKEKIKLPSEMKAEHEQLYQDLASTARSDFDARYIDVLEDINDDHSRLFEEQASQANDADVRAFAARKLGMLRANEDELSKVDDQLMQTHR